MRRRGRESGTSAKVWMSVFIGLLMVMSVFGIIIGSQSSDIRYGGVKFTQEDSVYKAKIKGREVHFYTLPFESNYLNFSKSDFDIINSSSFIITSFDPAAANESAPAIELARFDMATMMTDKLFLNGVIAPSPGYESLPVIGCPNATASSPAVIFNTSDSAGVVASGNCVYLNGRGADFLRIRDRLIYYYYGVVQNESG